MSFISTNDALVKMLQSNFHIYIVFLCIFPPTITTHMTCLHFLIMILSVSYHGTDASADTGSCGHEQSPDRRRASLHQTPTFLHYNLGLVVSFCKGGILLQYNLGLAVSFQPDWGLVAPFHQQRGTYFHHSEAQLCLFRSLVAPFHQWKDIQVALKGKTFSTNRCTHVVE